MNLSIEVDKELQVDVENSLNDHVHSVQPALNGSIGKTDDPKQAASIRTTRSSNSGGENDFRNRRESRTADIEASAWPGHAEAEIPPDPNIVGWDSETDPENPLNWTSRRRWTLIILVSLVSFMSGLSSSFFAPSVPGMMKEFKSTNQTLAAFVVTVFVLGLSAGPLASGPLSELYGRLIVFQTGNFGFLIFTIASAVATDLDMMIVFRFFQGCFAATPFTLGGAVIADVVHQEERGRAIAIFTFGVLFGPSVGPIMGGFLAAAKGWRWVFWVLSMPLGTLTIVCLILFRESYAPVLLARKAARLRKETGNPNLRSKYDRGDTASAHFRRGIGRAVKMLIFSPVILALSVYSGLSYAYFYLLITTLTPVFERTYHFPPDTVGLSYLGLGIGYMGGVAASAFTADRIFLRLTARHHGERRPEYRLILTMVGGACLPIAFFWFGWSADKKLHWIVPIIGTSFLGCGGALLLMSIQNYTIDAYTLYAASGLAANTIVRSMMASTIPLAAPALYDALGLGWGNSLLAFLAVGMVPLPWVFYFKGEKLRGLNAKRIRNL